MISVSSGVLQRGRILAFSAIGVGISAVSVAVLIRVVPPAQIGAALGAAEMPWVGLIALLVLASYPLRSYRWSVLLEPVTAVRQTDALSAQAIGLLGNTLLPARAGDLGRGFLIGRKTGIGVVTTLTTIAAERLLDVVANLFIVVVLALIVGLPRVSGLAAGLTGMVILAGLGVAVTVVVGGLSWRALTRRPPRWLPSGAGEWLGSLRGAIAAGLQVFSDRRALAKAAVLSLALWGVLGMTNYCGMLALGLQLPVHAAFVVLVAQTVGVAIPSSPAYVGTFHMATVLALSLYGIDPAASVPLAVITHAVGVVVAVAVGVPFLWYEGLSARELWRASSRPVPAVS